MAVNLNLPSRQTGTPEQQLNGLYSYLYQLVEALNVSLNSGTVIAKSATRAGGIGGGASAATGAASDEYQQIKALIVKTATEVTGGMRKVLREISEGYTSQNEFGTYEEYLNNKISAGSDGFMFEWDRDTSLISNVGSIGQYFAESDVYIKFGIVRHNDDDTVESGILIGKNFQKVTVDGKEYIRSEDVYALLTAEEISFWQSGVCISRLSLSGLEANMAQLDKLITSVIESEGGDASLAFDGGFLSAIAKQIDLTANESVKLSVVAGIETGSGVTITKDEVNINSPKTTFSIPAEDNEDGAELVTIDSDGLRADVVTAEEIHSPSIVNTIQGRTYTPTSAAEMQVIFNDLRGKYMVDDITIDASAVDGGICTLRGIHGNGVLRITGGKLNGLNMLYCSTHVIIDGMTFESGSTAITMSASWAHIKNCAFNAAEGLYAEEASQAVLDSCTGETTTLIRCASGSTISVCGTGSPAGLLGDVDGEVYSRFPFAAAEIEPEVGEIMTASIPANLTRTWASSWLSISSIGTAMYQGRYGENTLRRGCMWFDTATIAGKHIISATLTLKRVAGVGGGGAVTANIYGTTATGASGTPAIGTKYASVDLANGGTGTVDVTAAVQALADGEIAGLMIYDSRTGTFSGKSYTYGYMKVYGTGEAQPPTLNVTYK